MIRTPIDDILGNTVDFTKNIKVTIILEKADYKREVTGLANSVKELEKGFRVAREYYVEMKQNGNKESRKSL